MAVREVRRLIAVLDRTHDIASATPITQAIGLVPGVVDVAFDVVPVVTLTERQRAIAIRKLGGLLNAIADAREDDEEYGGNTVSKVTADAGGAGYQETPYDDLAERFLASLGI